ncbi:MAG: hypothetical protein GXY76_04385 [Chloroflexi bacterium]|nr:hypothetical protein [Chloroflexota bacterium]
MRFDLDLGLRRVADAIDERQAARAERRQRAVWDYAPVDQTPVIMQDVVVPDWPLFPYQEIYDHPDKMLWNQLKDLWASATLDDDNLFAVRAHYGTGTMASIMGAEVVVNADAPPWTQPLRTRAAIRRVIDRGMPELTAGLGRRVLETEQLFLGRLARYEPLRRHVHMFLADSQGPFDTAHLLWGSEIYYAMVDEPELVHQLLSLITEATIAFTWAQKRLIGEARDWGYHFFYRMKGGIRIVDDVAINLSPKMYAEFVLPYFQRLTSEFGGGYVHYCGHLLHHQALRLGLPGLTGLEMGFDNPGREPSYTFARVQSGAAERRVALMWHGYELSPAVAAAPTGVAYVARHQPGLPLEEARAELGQFRVALARGRESGA